MIKQHAMTSRNLWN